MKAYDHKEIEERWQKKWLTEGINKTDEETTKPKSYVLDMFPYPSGDGLHVGHPKGYIATDVYSRMKHMQGHRILHPMGWDAFGLPAEQFAIKNKVHPSTAVKKNTERFKEQLDKIGFNYDWEREVNTTDPAYYKWTQWIFLKLYERGLAYQSYEPINWCPSCQTGLANEDLENGKCERCGTPVEKKPMRQWVLKITDYADKLLEDIEGLNWPESIKESQKNWIGKSSGAEVTFKLEGLSGIDEEQAVTVFTTRPDTLFGATFIAISADLAKKWMRGGWNAPQSVVQFVDRILQEEADRSFEEIVDKEGVATDVFAVNPANGERVPVWVANYVLSGYGTGAIMAVPAHDDRDWEFAKKYGIPIIEVIYSEGSNVLKEAYLGAGSLINSGPLNDLSSEDAKKRITEYVGGRMVSQYKLRDWVFSRQRYWGEPIPVVHDTEAKAQKQKALIIHGLDANEHWGWIPWMKRELEARGFEVFTPSLPDALHPKSYEWYKVLEPIISKFGEHDVVIAHSLGTKAAVDLVLQANIPIGQMFLIASSVGQVEERNWKQFSDEFGAKMDIASIRQFWERPADLEKLGMIAKKITLINSDDDHIIKDHTNIGLPSSWEFLLWSGYGHFRDNEQPELLREILTSRREYGVYPVDPTELPVTLPPVESYAPSGTGESPLADISHWVNVEGYITERGTFVSCPREKAQGENKVKLFRRETNTMPQWAGSSWYYLRYIDPANTGALVDSEKEKNWSPVDLYVGGAEHATRHLIYARFWHKFLFDIGIVSRKEPFMRLENVGLIMASDGRKMSKRYGNVINPDDIVRDFGADTLRVYEMFMGPFDQSIAWSTDNLVGARRFIERVHRLFNTKDITGENIALTPDTETLLNITIKKVGDDIEQFKFNTAISQLMILLNHLEKLDAVPHSVLEKFDLLLAPFAPHLAEELWLHLKNVNSIHVSHWPTHDPEKLLRSTVIIAVQINGKLRETIEFSRESTQESIEAEVLKNERITKWLDGKIPKKIIFVPGKLVNIVV